MTWKDRADLPALRAGGFVAAFAIACALAALGWMAWRVCVPGLIRWVSA